MKLRRVLIAVVCAIALVACATEDAPPTSGVVRDKQYIPAHWQAGYEDHDEYGYHCGPGTYDFKYDCGFKWYTERVYQAQHNWVQDYWTLYLEDCMKSEDGHTNCKDGWHPVTDLEYRKYEVGAHYPEG